MFTLVFTFELILLFLFKLMNDGVAYWLLMLTDNLMFDDSFFPEAYTLSSLSIPERLTSKRNKPIDYG